MVSTLADGKRLVFHNSGALLTRPDGSVSPDIMPDFLHLTPRGYQLLADGMRPDIQKLMR
jgi:lysophospholipase L1-like esterase